MLFKMALVGDGSEDDSWRVSLPTYEMVAVNYDQRVAVVDVPLADIPPAVVKAHGKAGEMTKAELRRATQNPAASGDSVELDMVATFEQPDIAPALLQAWTEHLDSRYQEHAGEYSVDLR